ncbi:MAG: DNA polymerase III subunit delta', partial [Bacteroidales bacterium]|nr:DNA polymerase III subunit delta' [Bacteroidales bacterium]
MSFENIIGQKKVVSILNRAIVSNRMPHALLFHGPDGVGKEAVAFETAKSLLCQKDELYCDNCSDCKRVAQLSHPDLIIIFPSPKEPKIDEVKAIRQSLTDNPYFRTQLWAKPFILINTIRNLKKTVSMSSYENKGRVVIMLDAHRMTIEAANSLLKILEEPPGKITIILVSSKPDLLLSTIVSRCQRIKFNPLTWSDIEAALIERENISTEQANIVARMSFGNYRRALELLDENINEKQDLMIDILRKLIKNDLELMLSVENVIRQEDLKSIKDILALMMVWFRDAMVYESLNEENECREKIINADKLDTLQKFINSFEAIDYDQVLQKIEHAIEIIDRNVYLNLILLQ